MEQMEEEDKNIEQADIEETKSERLFTFYYAMVFTAIIVLVATFFAHIIPRDYMFQNFRTPLLGTMGLLTVLLIVACNSLDEYRKPTLWILILFIILMPLFIIVGMFILMKGHGYE